MGAEHYVIIGNGVAANRAADVLREGDPDGKVTLVSDEFVPFYYRHLLRDYVTGDLEESQLLVRPASYYPEHRIRLRLGQRVVKVDLDSRTLYLKHMEKLQYTRLLLCVGSKARIPEVHYQYRQHFTVLKTLTDARALRARFADLKHVLMVGGDLVSVRCAARFLKRGKRVTFLIDKDAFWPLECTPERRAELTAGLARRGAEVIDNDVMSGVEPLPGGGYEVRTRGGLRVPCDLVGAFFGLVPDVDFLMGSGLDVERGILVDEHLRTNVEDVYAAGDCAQVYNPDLRNWWVSIGWGNAERLGEVAARNLLGSTVRAGEPLQNALRFEGIIVNTSWWQDF